MASSTSGGIVTSESSSSMESPVTERGTVTGIEFDGDADLGTSDSTTYVYTPPGYNPESAERYSVVYLLHGTPKWCMTMLVNPTKAKVQAGATATRTTKGPVLKIVAKQYPGP